MKVFSRVLNKSYRSFATIGINAVLALCGVLAIYLLGPGATRDWETVHKLNPLDAETFEATAPNSSVLVTGVLEGNPTRTSDGLVAYVEQRQAKPAGGGDRYRESWTTVAQVWPPLSLQVDEQSLRVAHAESVAWGGSVHLSAPSPGGAETTDGAVQESEQVVGFKNGDRVTFVGRKGSEGSLIPTRIYGGDSAGLLKDLARDTRVAYAVGIAFFLAAFLMLFWRIVVRV
jgi:hypothetical protein